MPKKTKITWQAPDFKHYEKSLGWYVTLFSITLLISGFFIIVQKDIFAAVVIALIGGLVVFFSKQKPENIQIEIDHKSLSYKNIVFPFKQIRYFWIVNNENHKTLNLETTAFLNNIIILELGEQNPEELREFLIEYLQEHEETEETPIQRLIHWIKF